MGFRGTPNDVKSANFSESVGQVWSLHLLNNSNNFNNFNVAQDVDTRTGFGSSVMLTSIFKLTGAVMIAYCRLKTIQA